MPIRLTQLFTLVAVLGVAMVLSDCGGGGGGGSSVPSVKTTTPAVTQTATPVPGGCAPPAISNSALCTYTFQSNQGGLAVLIDGVQIGLTGATPIATSPPFSATPHTVQFGTGVNPYTVQLDQTASATASHTIYYNAIADTGSVSMVGAASFARAPQSFASDLRRSVNTAARTGGVAPTGVYVKYDSSRLAGQSIARIESTAGGGMGFDVLSSAAAIRGRIVRPAAGTDLATLTAHLQQSSGVVGVYPLHYRVPLTATPVSPNDPYYQGSGTTLATMCAPNCQWDLHQIDANYAWFYTPPGAQGTIAILDTGYDATSADFSSNVAFSGTTAGTGGTVQTAQGYGQGTNTTFAAAQDSNGHGTNVSGIADADTSDAIGFAGTAWGAKLFEYRIFPPATALTDQQSADTGDEAAAIMDALTRNKGPVDVISLSIGASQYDPSGGVGFDQAEHDAVEAAIAAGVTVVAAAGNEYAGSIDYPAAYDGVVSVGATSMDDGQPNGSSHSGGTPSSPVEYVASYSNSGPGLSLVAPGGDPNGTGDGDYLHWIFNDSTNTAAYAPDQCKVFTPPADVCKALFAGTSQATPHVSGTVALIQSALRAKGTSTLTPASMLALLEGTADNINDARMGHGRLNTDRAIEEALGVSPLTFPQTGTSPAQFVAFAYTNGGTGSNVPAIADVYYTHGVAIASNGTFRLADIPATTGTFRVAVWLDVNGDGKVDAGDQFGAAAATCTGSAKCTVGTITSSVVSGNFPLP